MLFLFNLFKPETWLDGSGTSTGIMGAIMNGLRTIFFWLVTIIYNLIANVYYLFEKLCNARLLSNEVLGEISKRVGLILGLIMFFYVVFSFIQMLIDPEKIENKESGALTIVKKVIIVIVLLGTSSACFELLYGVQRKIIDSQIIPNLIIPYTVNDEYKENFGNELSRNLLSGFYYIEQDYIREDGSPNFDGSNLDPDDSENADVVKACNSLTNMFFRQISEKNKYDLGYMCLNESVNVIREADATTNTESRTDQVHVINFNGLLAVGVGGYVLYMLAIYCFKIGVRMIQLAFLEIISPVAIISYMLPQKNNKFNEWLKIYFGTYIDVFIRILIIHFVVFLISVIFSANNNLEGNFIFWESLEEIKPGTEWLFTIVLILALLTFGKKAPELLKELLPAGASKIGFGASMKDIVGLKATLGMAAGAATGAAVGLIGGALGGKGVTGAIGGVIGGMFRGGKAGAGSKGIGNAISTAASNQGKANLARAQRIASGASIGDSLRNKAQQTFGFIGGYEKLESEVSSLNELKDDIEKEDVVKGAQSAYDQAWNQYVTSYMESHNGSTQGMQTQEQWKDDEAGGKHVAMAIDKAKQKAYENLYDKGGAFRTKVDMHNKRFGTDFDKDTLWAKNGTKDANGNEVKGINDIRKEKGNELEKRRAQKPKK